jgi:pimeloyl-ACP methyl ester carboxylesterase
LLPFGHRIADQLRRHALSGQFPDQGGSVADSSCCSVHAGQGPPERGFTGPRAARQSIWSLHVRLVRPNFPDAYILVGHSFGGFNARVFNGLYPDEVAGMVLVDSSHEDQQSPTPTQAAAERNEDAETRLFRRVYPVLFHLGIARLFLATDRTPLPEQLDAGLRYLLLKPTHVQAMVDEELASTESAEQVRESGSLGDKPLIVLTAGIGQNPASAELEQKLTRLSTHSQEIVVPNSGHLIPFEQPQAVVDAIQRVFDVCLHSR